MQIHTRGSVYLNVLWAALFVFRSGCFIVGGPKKLIHQKKWSFGNSRERTGSYLGIWFSVSLFIFGKKVCSGLSQTKLSLRSSFTSSDAQPHNQAKLSKFLRLSFFFPELFSSPSACTAAPGHGEDSLGLGMVSWTRLNPLEVFSLCLCENTELSQMGCSTIQLHSGNCCLGKERV